MYLCELANSSETRPNSDYRGRGAYDYGNYPCSHNKISHVVEHACEGIIKRECLDECSTSHTINLTQAQITFTNVTNLCVRTWHVNNEHVLTQTGISLKMLVSHIIHDDC
jgi:hypothetical protein